jgi:hypothetical protein
MKKRDQDTGEPVCEDVGSNGYCDVEAPIDGGSNMKKRDDDKEDGGDDDGESGEAEEVPVSKRMNYLFAENNGEEELEEYKPGEHDKRDESDGNGNGNNDYLYWAFNNKRDGGEQPAMKRAEPEVLTKRDESYGNGNDDYLYWAFNSKRDSGDQSEDDGPQKFDESDGTGDNDWDYWYNHKSSSDKRDIHHIKRIDGWGNIFCEPRAGWADAHSDNVNTMVTDLVVMDGTPKSDKGPRRCAMVECKNGDSTWWCNDVSVPPSSLPCGT